MNALPCPNCGSELSFLEQYHRQYCYSCGRYAPEGYGDGGAKTCPSCGGILSYIVQYDRYYCYRCNAYPAPEAIAEPKAAELESATTMPAATADSTPGVLVEPSKPDEPHVAPVEVVSEPTRSQEQAVEEEIPEGSATKPPLIRADILQAKKVILLDLCKAYGLDATGTKEQLRERLLSYLDELEGEAESAESAPEELPAESEAVEPSEAASPASSPAAAAPEEIPGEESEGPEPVAEAPASATPVVAAPTQQVPETPVFWTEPRIEHPCPTCGRELTYIAQYDRWYCYDCRAYAPAMMAKNACPNCGSALRWIERYERWWCDACRRYAPADLPRPELPISEAPLSVALEKAVVEAAGRPVTVAVHRHRSPGSGIGLMGLGLALFILYEVVVELPAVVMYNPGIVLAPDIAWGMRFSGFVFVAGGAMAALAAMRGRP